MADQISSEQMAEYKNIFDMFDEDHSGRISSVELGHVMEQLGEHPTKEVLDAMVREADADGDGEINFHEFLLMMANRFKRKRGEIKVNRDNGNILLDCRMDHFHHLPSQFQIK